MADRRGDDRKCLEMKQPAQILTRSVGLKMRALRSGRTGVRQLVACRTCRNFAMATPRRSLARALNIYSNQSACSCD